MTAAQVYTALFDRDNTSPRLVDMSTLLTTEAGQMTSRKNVKQFMLRNKATRALGARR